MIRHSIYHHIKNIVVLLLFLAITDNMYGQGCNINVTDVTFPENGGGAQRTLGSNCIGGIFGIGGKPSWITASISGSILYITASVNSGPERSGTIVITYNGNTSGGVLVSQDAATTPAAPTVESITNNCGNTVITRGNPPPNVTWYWQETNSGISIANSSKSVTRTSGTRYYLRARNNENGLWSSIRTINYTIHIVPSAPPTPLVTENCGSTTLSYNGAPPNKVTWYWQSSASGTSTSNANASITKTSGSTYYLRGRGDAGCWGPSVSVTYSIKAVPGIPAAPTITNNCQNTVLTRANPPSGITWYWQSSAIGTSTANTSISVTRTSGSTYYLRARHNNNLCWSTARTINYNIDPGPLWYADTDGDGLGDPNTSQYACIQPSGYVSNSNDKCPDEYGELQGCIYTPYNNVTLSDENYIFTRLYQREMISFNNLLYNRDVIESITYYDGLGRPKQQIAIKGTPAEKDLVTHIDYDDYGRQDKEYLPFASNGIPGAYKVVNVANDINSYYQNTYPDDFTGVALANVNAYSQSIFEPSPLNRVKEQGAPGKDWKANPNNNTDHTIKFDWDTNDTSEVIYFSVDFTDPNNTEAPTLVKNPNYVANQLYVNIIKDENWKPEDGDLRTTKEYKDKLGRVVLKRTFIDTSVPGGAPEGADTYYVYDDFGNLTFVIPPKVDTSDGVSNSELTELCYQYKYDFRNRLIEKKIPGKDWEYIVYNKLDQPVLTQHANLRKENSGLPYHLWQFTKYDAFGRVAYTGLTSNNSNLNVIRYRYQDAAIQYETRIATPNTMDNIQVYYSKDARPTGGMDIYTVNYYDDYTFLQSESTPEFTNPQTVLGQTVVLNTKSLPTGSKVRVLETAYPIEWITTVTYYDKKGRAIYVASNNEHHNTIDVIETQYDFAGKVLKTKTTHTKEGNAPIITIDTFEYDHVSRLLTQTQKINTQNKEVIAENSYDALGQLTSKKVGGGLQKVDYTYNVRGWLKGINNGNTANGDLFGFAIDYNNGANPLYNGNISKTSWKAANDNIARNYTYTYDALNRITAGISSDNNYNLSNVTYDKMGNILSLNRKGHTDSGATTFGDMDILSYTYDDGNKLLSVTDTANKTYGFKEGTNTNDDFEYDLNGNLTIDRNKGITDITYNHLNLPTNVTISNSEHNGNITYIYDATGAKLKKTVSEGSSLTETEYTGNFVYKDDVLEFMHHPEGYVEKEVDSYIYVYQYKDHLGNVRLSYSDKNKNGSITQDEIVEENNYYPFGLTHKGYNNVVTSTNSAQNYKYNGKELSEELGLDWYDYGARNYQPDLGRWFGVDGLAEKYLSNSPYHYANNNPVLNYDVDGNYFVNSQSLLTAMIFQQNSRQQIEKNNKSIEQLQGLIDGGELSKNAVANLNGLISGLEGTNSELQTSIDEVSTLMGSSQGYNIENAGAFSSDGHTTYDFNTGVVNIKAPLGNDFGLLGHEIHHAYQFDQGITSLASSSGVRVRPGIDLIGVDLADEWNAYKRQEAIEPGSSPYNTYSDLDNDSNSPYASHPRTPQSVSQHAQIQKILNSNGSKADKARWLNNLSKRFQQAFRINGKTYDGKN